MKQNNNCFVFNRQLLTNILFKIYLLFLFLFLGLIDLSASSTAHQGKESSQLNDILTNTSERVPPQGKEILGTVSDINGNPLPGASIVVKGTVIGVVTGREGNFNLVIPVDAKSIVISFIGMQSQQIDISTKSNFNIVLEETATGIDEVVIVAYGKQKKETVTGAISSILSKDLLQSPQANISNALAGRMSGLLTVQRSGEPGNDQTEIRIRGIGTFSGSQEPLVMIDGIESDNYNNLDPNEIENVSILKDASATAVFGVRGANGVLLITTKRGKLGKPQVSYSYNLAVTEFIDIRENMNSYDHALTQNEASKYDSYISGGYIPAFDDFDLAMFQTKQDPIFYPDVDWHKQLLQPYSSQTQHNLNISGGTKDVKYFVSMGYFKQSGLLNNTNILNEFDAQIDYKRYNFRSNFDFNITKDFIAKINISSTNENRKGKGEGTSISSLMAAINRASPSGTPGVIDGKLIDIDVASSINPYFNMFNYGYSREYRNYLKGSVSLIHKLNFITEGLSARATISYQGYNSQRNTIGKLLNTYKAKRIDEENVVYIPQLADQPFSSHQSFGKNRTVYAEMAIDYARSFGNHNITGLALYNQSKRYDPSLEFLVPRGYQGLVGRVTYDYKKRYLAEYNIGYNGTENFAKGKRFGFFPAYSLGWVLSEEPFFPKNNIISFIKFRGSYGEVGNDRIGGSRFLYRPSSYEYSGGYYFGEVGSNYNYYLASEEGRIGNPDLTWERAIKTDIGLELTLWKQKIRISVDRFEERRDNILSEIGTLPSIVGAKLPAYNLGKMKNGGIDGEVSFNSEIGKLHYWMKGIYTYAHNEILFKDEVVHQYPYQNKTGQRYGQYFGYLADGLYNTWEEINDAVKPMNNGHNRIQPGDVKYKDVNGDGAIDGYDYVPIGYSNFPEKSFGISFGGEYRGFDFSMLFQGATNVSTRYYLSSIAVRGETRAIADYLSGVSWTQELYEQGASITFPHVSQTNGNYSTSSYWIVDASYLRLKNAELGYNFQSGLLRKINVNSARIFINGNNLLTWSHLLPGTDPEMGAAIGDGEPYPLTSTYNIGINLKF